VAPVNPTNCQVNLRTQALSIHLNIGLTNNFNFMVDQIRSLFRLSVCRSNNTSPPVWLPMRQCCISSAAVANQVPHIPDFFGPTHRLISESVFD